MNRFLLLLIPALCTPCARAQDAPPTVTATEWSATRSRALYSSLDSNADDRLDLLEAARLKTLAGVTDLDNFRRLDGNRNGYLDFTEFDAHFRDLVAYGHALRLTPARPELVQERKPAPVARPGSRLLALFDENGDGALQRQELASLVQEVQVPEQLVRHFDRLDRDRSGAVTAAEFEPFLAMLPVELLPAAPAPAEVPTLPRGFGAYDLNLDGRIDRSELARYLWRLDPALSRWEGRILKHADENGDGALSADELARAYEEKPAPRSATRRGQTN